MGRIRKDALDLEFLPETSKVKFIGPKRITCFSTYFDEELRQVHVSDNSSQRYLDVTKLDTPINCLEGYNPESELNFTQYKWPYFMRWIGDNDEVIGGLAPKNESQQQIDFICTNSELKQIMLSLYHTYDWIIHAFRIRGEIFLHFSPDTDSSDNMDSNPQDNPMKTDKLTYAKINVTRKITKAVSERETNSNNNMDLLATISLSKIGQHRILHTGGNEFVMSKDDADKPIDQANFAALKLRKKLFRGRKGGFNISFYRHLYWWASTLLTGVKTLVCGDLDEDYSLSKLEVLPVSILNTKYHAAAQKKCLITLDKILHFIKSEVQEENKVYEFHLDAETKEVIVSPSVRSIVPFATPWEANYFKNIIFG